jgi:hypothetical protein
MKKIFYCAILLLLVNTACKKEYITPKAVIKVYKTDIKHTSINEPKYLYWYVRKDGNGYNIVTNTLAIYNFMEVNWVYHTDLPKELIGLKPFGETYAQISTD